MSKQPCLHCALADFMNRDWPEADELARADALIEVAADMIENLCSTYDVDRNLATALASAAFSSRFGAIRNGTYKRGQPSARTH